MKLYSKFGLLTVELIDMLKYIDDDCLKTMQTYLRNINQVLDEKVIQKLFEQLDLTVYDSKFQYLSFL
ncbi:MAG: hypothetical protein ACYTX0_63065, partial [Nostoc sp.]